MIKHTKSFPQDISVLSSPLLTFSTIPQLESPLPICLIIPRLEFLEPISSIYSETSGNGASGIGEPLKSGHLNFAKIFSHTNEPLESGK